MFNGGLRSIFTQYSIQYSGHSPFSRIDPICSDMLRCVLVQKSSWGNGPELLYCTQIHMEKPSFIKLGLSLLYFSAMCLEDLHR